jgi:hypothetical protein
MNGLRRGHVVFVSYSPRLVFRIKLYGGVFYLSRACTKTFFSINASKLNAFCVFAKKDLVDEV